MLWGQMFSKFFGADAKALPRLSDVLGTTAAACQTCHHDNHHPLQLWEHHCLDFEAFYYLKVSVEFVM